VEHRFDATAGSFRATLEADDPRLSALQRALGPVDGRDLLEVGCGKGRFARHFFERGGRVVGLDRSRAMLGEATPGPFYVRGSARCLPFGERRFDSAFAVEVVQHLSDQAIRELMRELVRVIRPGGRVVILDRNLLALGARRPWLPELLRKWIDERRGRWMYRPGDPVRERWFLPWRFRDWLGRWFEDVRVEFVLLHSEGRRRVFRAIPWARSMCLWTATVPKEADRGRHRERA
jgi:SAM-dependent methyltransferase